MMSCWSLFYMLVTFCNTVLMLLFPTIYLYSCSPHPLYIGMLFCQCFFFCFFSCFTWHWLSCFLITFSTTCKTSSIKISFLLATRLAKNLTQVFFHELFVVQHVTHSLIYLGNKNINTQKFINKQDKINKQTHRTKILSNWYNSTFPGYLI